MVRFTRKKLALIGAALALAAGFGLRYETVSAGETVTVYKSPT